MEFTGGSPRLAMGVHNTGAKQYVGGTLHMTTEGWGCIVFFCQWGQGPTLLNETCDWGFCHGEKIFLDPGQRKNNEVDFTDALTIARGTTGCCAVNNQCGCMIRGIATFHDGNTEICKVSMGFRCNLQNLNQCVVVHNDAEEVPVLTKE